MSITPTRFHLAGLPRGYWYPSALTTRRDRSPSRHPQRLGRSWQSQVPFPVSFPSETPPRAYIVNLTVLCIEWPWFSPVQFRQTGISDRTLRVGHFYRFCGRVEDQHLAIVAKHNRRGMPGFQKEAPYSENRGLRYLIVMFLQSGPVSFADHDI